jgi:hypothetical protein
VDVGVVQAGRDAEVVELGAPVADAGRDRAQGLMLAAIAAQGPGPVRVDGKRRGEPAGLPRRQRRQPGRLERRRGRAGLEPDGPAAGRHAGDDGVRPAARQHGAGPRLPGPGALRVDPVLRVGQPSRITPWRHPPDRLGRLDVGELHRPQPIRGRLPGEVVRPGRRREV